MPRWAAWALRIISVVIFGVALYAGTNGLPGGGVLPGGRLFLAALAVCMGIVWALTVSKE